MRLSTVVATIRRWHTVYWVPVGILLAVCGRQFFHGQVKSTQQAGAGMLPVQVYHARNFLTVFTLYHAVGYRDAGGG